MREEVKLADEQVVLAVRRRQRVEAEEIAALLEARRLGVHEALGFGSFHAYAEARLALSARMAYERVRVVEALARLPLRSPSPVCHCWAAPAPRRRVAAAATSRRRHRSR